MKNSGELWRIILVNTGVYAILWASDSGLQTVPICVQVVKTRINKGFLGTMDGHWSGKGAALPPLPPLRTGRETFASSGSSRTKGPRERSRFHNRFDPGFSAREAGLLVERTSMK